MWLILTTYYDPATQWLYEGLTARGLNPVEIITAEMLATGVHWKHTVGVNSADTVFTLPDGRTVHNATVRGVINRIMVAPTQHYSAASPSEQAYAIQEFSAFFLSWLNALPKPVFNPPSAQGLAGQWRHTSEWVWLAGQAGLPVKPYRQSSADRLDVTGMEPRLVPWGTPVHTLIVCDGTVTGALAPLDIQQACLRLATLANTPLLGIDFTVDESGWAFAGASPMPDLRLGGSQLLDILTAIFQSTHQSAEEVSV